MSMKIFFHVADTGQLVVEYIVGCDAPERAK